MSIDPNDFLLGGGGAPAAKFPTIGTVIKGTVLNSEVAQQIDFATQKPKFYDDGNPAMQVVITVQTDDRDPSIENDDGKRRLFVRGQMREALGDALRGTGAKLEKGGTLAVQYVADKPSNKGNPAKQYRAQYAPPSQLAAANDALLDAPQEQQPVGVAAGDLL